MVRSSSVMAIATLASRGTGFLRTLVLVYALSVSVPGNAYNNANTLPNAVYNLMLGGILTAAVVPLLVNAAKRDADRGEAYNQRMFTLVTAALFGITLVATLAASLFVDLYAPSFRKYPAEYHLTVIFAYFFVPQIFFYGMSSLIGAVLNARGRFAAPMWTPVINNVVVIGVLGLFMTTGGSSGAQQLTSGQIQLLGWGTTLGIVAQTVALFPSLRRAGFRWRPRFDFRRAEVTEIMRMAGPLFGYILTTQAAFLVVQIVANAASTRHGTRYSYDGFGTYSYAWQLFQLPYALVGISVITALLPRMSAHAAERRYTEVKRDFASGVLLSSVIVVPASLILFVLGSPVADALLGYGHNAGVAGYQGAVFGVFSLGLVPYMIFQLQLRVFYALHDAKTPMLIGLASMAASVVTSALAFYVLPAGHVVQGLGVSFGLGNVVGMIAGWRVLSRRMRGLGGRDIGRTLGFMHLAAIPAAIFGLATSLAVAVILQPGPEYGIVTSVLGGGGGLVLYMLFARAFGVTEFDQLISGLRTRLGR